MENNTNTENTVENTEVFVTTALVTNSDNFLIKFGENYYFISQDLRILRESDESEFDFLGEQIDRTMEFKLERDSSLYIELERRENFAEDAANLEYFRIEALMRVYPMINKDCDLLKLSEHKGLLLERLYNYSYSCSAGDSIVENTVSLYDKDKIEIGKVKGDEVNEYASNSVPNYESKGETPLECIARLNIQDEVCYILEEHYNNGSFNDRTVTSWQKLYIVDSDLSSLIDEVRQIASDKLNS